MRGGRSMVPGRVLLLGALAAATFAAPLAAQSEPWQYRWYWGAKGGALGYSMPTLGQVFSGQVGGDWLITARRTGLYIGYSQTFQAEADTFTINNQPNTQVTFDAFRRIQIGIVAFVGSGNMQPYVGGGFALHTLTNIAPPTGSSAAVQNAVANAGSVGIAMFMGGIQYHMGRRTALYAHWQGAPGSRDFLLGGSINSFEGGIRYALSSAKSDDATARR
jgi:hypothetical protein